MNVFDLQAKISLDAKDYEKGLGEAKSKFSGFADGLKSAVGKVGDVLAGIGKAAAVGVGAASTALTALTKQSLDAVGTYEQMVGGVNKIFEESAQKVIDFSHEAYKSAGLSANEYMEVVTSFSASLVASLKGDTEQAADLANMAIKDMSDNANVFGSDLASIQNAYTNFAKQNYMLLDNLKLGYGGTAREMARLLNESGVLGNNLIDLDDTKGLNAAINEAGFAKIIEAIHKTQERLNIIDTTKNEAFGTLEGSARAARAAWQNFLTGVGSPEQFSEQISVAISNISKNLHNIIPRLTEGLTELVDLLAPEIPPIIEETLPAIIQGSSTLLTGLAKRLPQLLTAILPSLAEGVVDVTTALVGVLPDLITSLKKSIPIVVQTIMSKKDELLQAGKDIISALFPSDMKAAVTAGSGIVNRLIDGLLSQDSIDAFVEAAPKVIENLVEAIKTVLLGGEQDGEGGIFGAAKEIVVKLGDYFSDEQNRKNFLEAADKVIRSLGSGLISILQNGVAPLMVETARAWAEAFVGEIDYDDAAWDIISRLGKAFINNMLTGGILGKWLDEASRGYTQEIEDNIGVQSTYYTSEGMLSSSWNNAAAKNAYQQYKGYATGFYATQPTWLNHTLVGENGKEVLLPIERNTEWMDILAEKMGGRLGGGNIYITVNAPTSDARAIVSAFDEEFRNLQIMQDRSRGGTGWK